MNRYRNLRVCLASLILSTGSLALSNAEDDEAKLAAVDCKSPEALANITVGPSAELFINDPIVLNSPAAKPGGKWSFSYAIREILEIPSPGTSPQYLAVEDTKVKQFIKRLTAAEKVNSFTTPLRASTQTNLETAWGKVKGTDGKSYFSFDKAPFKLIAIVNRLDLVKKGRTAATAGEGRFVFGFTGEQLFTVIFEYDLATGTASPSQQTRASWTNLWHSLKNHLVDTDAAKPGVQPDQSFPTALAFKDKAGYLAKLEKVTELFANRKSQIRQGTTTQASIAQIRTNELSDDWSLREIIRTYDAEGKSNLSLTTLKNNPDRSLKNGEKGLSAWIEANVSCLDDSIRESCFYTTADGLLPKALNNNRVPVLAAADVVDFEWFTGSTNTKQRFVALNTCGGCHNTETAVSFLHVDPNAGEPSSFAINEIKNPRLNNFKNLICLVENRSAGALTQTGNELGDLDQRLDFSLGVD